MHKILIRAGMSPLDTPDIDFVLHTDRVGGNSGNLIYQYSVYRTLMTKGTQFTSRYFRIDNVDEAFIEQVNSEYDCVILPLANAFRPQYRLKEIAAFIRRMKIPCVVIGCGVQADSISQIERGFSFDEDAKELVSAVLDRSAMLGLRGEMTAKYLQKLGFAPERHFTVIGCPSMYSHGINLPQPRELQLNAASRISINVRQKQTGALDEMTARAMAEFPDYHMVFQTHEELALLRYGVPVVDKALLTGRTNSCYPRTLRHPMLRQGRGIAFVNARAWHGYMKRQELSFGSRIHGNIAAVLNGVPAFVFTTDTRTEELCRYHNIQFMPAGQLQSDADIRDICEKADFSSVLRGHEQRFRHFVDFLNANGLEHIYQNNLNPENVPFDRALAQLPEWGMLQPEPMTLRRYVQGAYAYATIARKAKNALKRR